MSVSDKMKWKRMVNEVRFLHNEKDLIVEVIKEHGPQFHEYYLNFSARNGLDVFKLNQENSERIKDLYGSKAPKFSPPNFSDFEDAGNAISTHVAPRIDDEDYQLLQDDKEISESFRKLFKQLALKLHPDKITGAVTIEQGMENLRLFQEAQSALREKRYFVLLDLAERYNVTQPRNYKQQIRWMKKESERLNNRISEHKQSYNYIFAECETDEQRDTLVRRFLMHLFQIEVQ